MGDPDPEAELADIQAALGAGTRDGPRARIPMEVSLSFVSRHHYRRFQPACRHQRDSVLPEQYLRCRRLQPDLERPAGNRHRHNQLSVYHCRHVADRQAGPQDVAADRRGGLRQLPCRRGLGVRNRIPSRRFAVAAGYVHCVLQRFAGRCDLGLYRRSVSDRGAFQGPGSGQRQSLVQWTR